MTIETKEKSFVDNLDEIVGGSDSQTKRDTTPVAGLINGSREEIARKERRRQELIIEVDPNRTRMWKFSDRTETDEELDISDLKESMAPGKDQILPALARKITGELGIDYELIYGRRRRTACVFHGRRISIRLTDANDQECSWYMEQENSARKDITAMQRAKSYIRQLKEGLYKSVVEMQANLKISPRQMARSLKAGKLWFDEDFVSLVGSVKDISLKDAEEIIGLRDQDEVGYREELNAFKNDVSLSKKDAASKAKIILKTLKQRAIIKKTFSAEYEIAGGIAKVKTDQKGNLTLKLPADFLNLNRDKLVGFIKNIRADIES